MGDEKPTWRSSQYGLFSEHPHLSLQESFWDDTARAAIQRYYVIDAATGEVSRYGQTINAYDDDGYRQMLTNAGFENVTLNPSMGEDKGTDDLMVITAIKPG